MEYIRLHHLELVDLATLGYSGAVKPARPGIASANRRRLGSFASLIDLILDDDSALDGLTFAYAELEEAERRALTHAVLQDSGDPAQALIAFLAVEESPTLRQRLVGLISRHGRIDQSAFLAGTEAQGHAHLLQSLPGLEPESLQIAWEESKIHRIELESRTDWKIATPAKAVAVSEAVETLAPLVWRHIRSGRELPDGVERFAGFFSIG
jgi:hypothetical protein